MGKGTHPRRRHSWMIHALRSQRGRAWLARYLERREGAQQGMLRLRFMRRAQGMRLAQPVRWWRGQ